MAKALYNKGFPFFDDMAVLVGATHATGGRAFRAGQTIPAPSTQNAAASALTSYESAINPEPLEISHERRRVSDKGDNHLVINIH